MAEPLVAGPLAIIVLDGWGLRAEPEGNAVLQAATPTFDRLWQRYPHTQLQASGEAVGLQPGQMGNSNVGHLNLGAGRIVYQDLVRIDRAIASGALFDNHALLQAMHHARAGHALHLVGLVSPGGVHSHTRHLLALVTMAQRVGVERVFIHALLDGRDTPPRSARAHLAEVQAQLEAIGRGRVVTVIGRYYAMDRDQRWERTRVAYEALVQAVGRSAASVGEAIELAYAAGENDEFVHPTAIVEAGENVAETRIRPHDAVIFFNFRADRARQLTRALADPQFDAFPTLPLGLHFVQMAPYDEALALPTVFPAMVIERPLGEVVSDAGWRQLRIAETEKYAHVTYFFNGGVERRYPGEERILVPSPKVATYDLQPEMSAFEVADKAAAAIANESYALVVLNFANPDMVGHTGVFPAAVRAVEATDQALAQVVDALWKRRGGALVLADHGNADMMIDPDTGAPHTAHTLSPVPLILVAEGLSGLTLRSGVLADVAPTWLQLKGLAQPAEMDGRSLVEGAPSAGH